MSSAAANGPAMSSAPRIRIESIACCERDVVLRQPFRFGVVTLAEAPQLFVRVTVEDRNRRRSSGYSAELMVPKWFDKNPELDNEANIEQLRQSVRHAAGIYRQHGDDTAFGFFANLYARQMNAVAPPLVASFGQAILDRAINRCRLPPRRHLVLHRHAAEPARHEGRCAFR